MPLTDTIIQNAKPETKPVVLTDGRVLSIHIQQCTHRHRFETLQQTMRVIGDWVRFYNQERPHQALKTKTPAEAYALAG